MQHGSGDGLAGYVSGTGSELRSALQIDNTVYFEKNTSTALKLSILRRLFALYDVDPMELVFYLKDPNSEKMAEASRFELRRRYWTYALPLIQKQHMHRGSFGNVSPGTSNTVAGFFGISGCSVQCIANYDGARIDFYLGSGDAAWNKASFDLLHSHKDEIEEELGISLNWVRADQYKASWISYELKDVSIADEGDWPRMAKFHAEWSDAICNAVLPYLQNTDELEQRLSEIAGILREWTVSRPEVKENLAKCNRTLTRFTTDQMSEIFPDLPGAPQRLGHGEPLLLRNCQPHGRQGYIFNWLLVPRMQRKTSWKPATGSVLYPSSGPEKTDGSGGRFTARRACASVSPLIKRRFLKNWTCAWKRCEPLRMS